jgi:nucleotide-binding universal stress UspA family protein
MSPKLETMLVGVDLTAPSLASAAWVARTFAPEARIVLVHALETSAFRRFFSAQDAKDKTEDMRAEVSMRMEEMRTEFGADRCKVVVTDGAPGVRLAEIAREEDASLIAVGAYRETFASGLLGSVVSTLLGSATVPVLIAHGIPDGPPTRALVAIDGSDVDQEVLAWVRTLTEAFRLEGQVFSAIEPPGIAVNTTLFSSDEEYENAKEKVIERVRLGVREAADEAGLAPGLFEAVAVYGRPELEIALAADRMGADLLVLGTRGHGRGHALVLGSVSRRVIEASSCPVLVVPPSSRR